MKKILITGGSGLLGTSLINLSGGRFEIAATYNSDFAAPHPGASWHKLDLTEPDQIRALIDQEAPDVVIHAGSIGSVDFADKNRDLTRRINVDATRTVADAAERSGAQLIFISSNAVFDGNNPPYSEEDPVSPVNYYGELKVEGEEITRASNGKTTIVRPILMYGWPNDGRRGNLVTIWLSKLAAGEQIVAVNDVWSKPLWVDDAARVCWAVAEQGAEGTFNVCGGDRVTLHDLALQVASTFGYDQDLVQAVPSSHFGNIASRPKDTSFTNAKIAEQLDIQPLTISQGLTAMRDCRR